MKPSLLLVTLFAACGDDPPRKNRDRPAGEDPDPVVVATVNGLDADDYYDGFTWETTGSYVVGLANFPTQPDGRDAFLVHLYLLADGRFVLFYEEGDGEVDTNGWGMSSATDTQRRREGRWTVDGATLDVGGLLACSGLAYNGEETLYCTLASAIVSDVAVGSAIMLEIDRFGPSAPTDGDWGDYRE